MRFLCDVHIAIRIAKQIELLGFFCKHVNQILDKWHSKDEDIAEFADKNDLILITKDQDFRTTFLLNNRPKKLIKVNLGNISNTELFEIIKDCIDRLIVLPQTDSFMIEINGPGLFLITK